MAKGLKQGGDPRSDCHSIKNARVRTESGGAPYDMFDRGMISSTDKLVIS